MRNGIIRKKMQKTVLKQGVQITLLSVMTIVLPPGAVKFNFHSFAYGAVCGTDALSINFADVIVLTELT